MNQSLTLNRPLRSIFWASENRFIRDITLVLVGVVLLSLSAQLVIPIKPVPLTFQSAMAILLGMTLGARLGAMSVISYIVLGSLGLPIFANLGSGLSFFGTATAGYLVGFLPAAMLGGFLAARGFARNTFTAFISSLLSASVLFFIGVLFLARLIGLHDAIIAGVMPFIVTEPLKLLAISLVIPRCWKK